MDKTELLNMAKNGDIRSFNELYSEFQPQLKSYLYRLLANRNDMEDMAQDIFILSFEKLYTFRSEASLKTWVFTIATNHANRFLKKRSRWFTDTFERTRELAHQEDSIMRDMQQTNLHSNKGIFEIHEHIDYCFTCVSKMLPIKQQIVLILKDIYDFKIKEITEIMNISLGTAKHALHNARTLMIKIFDDTCALVSKAGICDQCSGLNGKFNPKQDKRRELMKIKMYKEQTLHDNLKLYDLRKRLVKNIDPLKTNGADLHEIFMNVNHRVNSATGDFK